MFNGRKSDGCTTDQHKVRLGQMLINVLAVYEVKGIRDLRAGRNTA